MKAQIAFYKAKGDYVDKAIRVWTNSPYSHCELVIGDLWYSSSPRDGGVRSKKIAHNDDWDYVDISIDEKEFYKYFNKVSGQKYDFLGIVLSQVIPLGIQNPNKKFCSEFIATYLGYADPERYSPARLFRRMNNV